MPIKFTCPHCKKVLSVKDQFAGKKGPCPACKKILTVPLETASAPAATNGQSRKHEAMPQETPPEDAEAAAAAALADKPPPVEETKEPKTIEFNCPFCDEPLTLDAELAGKRAPCPECKHIIKVPELKKQAKIDWRTSNAAGLPTGARRPMHPPEGSWGSAAASTVSRQALEEADVLPDRRRPLTVREKIARGLLLGAAAVGFFLFAGVAVAWWMSSREARTLQSVQDYAASPAAKEKIDAEGVATLYAGIGEYILLTKRNGCAKEAQTHFGKALDTLNAQAEAAGKDSERDAVLADLALLLVELGGDKDEIDATVRVKWDEAQNAVGKALRAIHHPEARLEAYRSVCRRLLAKKRPDRAFALAPQLSDKAEEKWKPSRSPGWRCWPPTRRRSPPKLPTRLCRSSKKKGSGRCYRRPSWRCPSP